MKKHDVAKKMTDYVELAKSIQKKGYKRNLSSKEIAKQKGKMSLNSVGKNEGENMMMGKNNTQRA